jgi:hypothetical protein
MWSKVLWDGSQQRTLPQCGSWIQCLHHYVSGEVTIFEGAKSLMTMGEGKGSEGAWPGTPYPVNQEPVGGVVIVHRMISYSQFEGLWCLLFL